MKRLQGLFFLAVALVFSGSALNAQTNLVISAPSLSFQAQAGGVPPAAQNLTISSSGAALTFTAGVTTNSGGNWLAVSPPSATTPATLAVSVNSVGLPAGIYTGFITFTSASASNSPQVIPVSLTVGPASQLTSTPTFLSFNYQTGAPAPAPQNLAIASSGAALTFTATPRTNSGGNWIVVNPTTGTTGTSTATMAVAANTTGLAAGVYTGYIEVAAIGATTIQIPISLTITATPSFTLSTSTLTFAFQIGGANPAQQQVTVSSTGSPISFGAFKESTGGDWLVVTPVTAATPATLTVGVNPTGLPVGTFTGKITIRSQGLTIPEQVINVSLIVSTNPLLTVNPGSLSFSYQIGAATPPGQNITPASTSGTLTYAAEAKTEAGGNWLTISATSGSTGNPLTVGINPTGLATGTYNGSVTLNAAGGGNNPVVVPVRLTVTNEPLLTFSSTSLTFNFQVGGTSPATQTVSVGSTTTPLNYTLTSATQSGGNWLTLFSTGGSTPSDFLVGVNPAGLGAGAYTGTITVTAPGAANTPQTIQVTLNVSTTPLLNVSPTTVAFTYQSGGAIPNAQSISITSTGDPLNFTVTFTTSSGGGWLAVTAPGGTTPTNINLLVNPAGLVAGSYNGTVEIASPNATNSPQRISVTLAVVSGSLNVAPATLAFTQALGGAAPAAQTLAVTSTGAVLNFTAAASTSIGGAWLTITPASGATPGNVSVTATGAGLAQGTYLGRVTVAASGAAGSPRDIPVTLTIGPAPSLVVAPASVSFSGQVGSPAPANQTVQVTGTGGNVPVTVTAATSTGGSWLTATPASGTTPVTLSIGANITGLAAGTYNGTVTVTSSAAGNSPQTISVTLNMAAAPTPVVAGIVNNASGVPGAVAPGEIIYVGGTNMGPTTLTTLQVTSGGTVATTLAETQVLFDGIPSPLVFVKNDQLSAVIPYEIAGRVATRMQVSYRGVMSPAIELRVTDAAPGIFTMNQSGSGPAALINQNGSVNSTSNPAAKGSIVVFYATGEGQTNPAGVTGRVTPADGSSLSRPVLNTTVLIGGRPAEVLYAGSAPGFVAGDLQVNVRVPADAPSGSAVPIILMVGSASSQANVTLAIQ